MTRVSVFDWIGPRPVANHSVGICIEPASCSVRLLRETEHVRIGRGPTNSLHFELRQDGWIACAAIFRPLPESEWLATTRVLMAEFRERIAVIEANA